MGIKFLICQISSRFGESYQDFGECALKNYGAMNKNSRNNKKWDAILVIHQMRSRDTEKNWLFDQSWSRKSI